MKRPMIALAAAWLSGILIGRQLPGGLFLFLCSYFIIILIFLLILRRCPALLFPYVRKERYFAMTLFLVILPLLFCGGYARQRMYEKRVAEALESWQQLEEDNETQVFVIGTVTEKAVEEDKAVFTLSDCLVCGYQEMNTEEGETAAEETEEEIEEEIEEIAAGTWKAEIRKEEIWSAAGNCQVTVEEEGSKWISESLIGNTIRVYGKFYLYDEAGNPGQFDAASYYHGKGLFASVKALRVDVLSDEIQWSGHVMFLLKQRMRETLRVLYPADKAGVLAAMLLGDKDLLPDEVKELYQQNGISHILAISGLHISMLCMGFFGVLRRVGISLRVSAVFAMGFLCFYVAFTGAGTSSLRAGIMCLVLIAARLLRRSYDLLSSLSFAAILVTLVRPQEIMSAGFLLSFGAVLGVAVAKEAERVRKERRDTVCKEVGKGAGKSSGKGQVVLWSAIDSLMFGGMIQLVTLPVSLWFYYELSPYSILLNLVIIPLASFILGGGLFSVLLGLFVPEFAKLLAGGTYLLLSFYEWIGRVTQKLPYSFVLLGRPEGWQMVVYYVGLAIVLWGVMRERTTMEKEMSSADKREIIQEKGCRSKRISTRRVHRMRGLFPALGSLFCLVVLLLPKAPSFALSFLDVSQGDGIVLQTEEGKVLLFDGGSTDVSGIGEYRISPFFKQQGIALIDMVSVSHMDSDHYSGVLELLEAMPVYEGRAAYLSSYEGAVGICELILPEVTEPSEEYLEMVALCEEKNVAVRYLSAGDELYREEDLLIECLSPVDAKESENDTSLVFLMQTPELVVWLMGDTGVETEEEIIHRLGEKVRGALSEKFCILKVGHHGSKTSTGDAFVSYVEPDACVISCGYQNSYGHPHAEVVRRLLDCGCRIYRTDLQGCVMVKSRRSGEIVISGWR